MDAYLLGLVEYAVEKQLITAEDRIFAVNSLLDALGESSLDEAAQPARLPLPELLEQLTQHAVDKGLCEDNQVARDLFDTRLMGVLTPFPHEVRARFRALYAQSPRQATDWFYRFSQDTNYIRRDRIARDRKWQYQSPYGALDITINLSKPEKDPRAIAAARLAPQSAYPKCQLCCENEGYAGRMNHPARQNHRVIPLTINGAPWYLQYSPYVYYPEHCIVLSGAHTPMKIDRAAFAKLLDFVSQFPHYMLGSNADLPIVGGSILNHDHFQGGRYSFPMDQCGVRAELTSPNAKVKACVLDWPMAAVQLSGTDETALIDEAERILNAWRGYSDPDCDVYAETEGTPHNTITPILRRVDGVYRLNLVLRNNRTSEEHPLGIFHPHAPLHHIKKENIGLIEVMGLFILPGRLKTELALLQDFLTGKRPMVRPEDSDPCAKHYDWLEKLVAEHGLCKDDEEAAAFLRSEVAKVCAQVLADAGVYKQDEKGLAGIKRFMATVGYQG